MSLDFHRQQAPIHRSYHSGKQAAIYARNIGIDYRLQSKPLLNDLAIESITVPEHLSPASSIVDRRAIVVKRKAVQKQA
jgi:hypothetical protein